MDCNKCGTDVPRENDASLLDALRTGNLVDIVFTRSHHLLPIVVDGKVICEGSPSRAQYLEGQPRDTRGYAYDPELEEPTRRAYQKLQRETPQDAPGDDPA